jgi:hypothetical protein
MVIQRAMSFVWLILVATTILPSLGVTAEVTSPSGERVAILTAVAADLRSPGPAPKSKAEWHVESADLAALELAQAVGAAVRVTAPGAPATQCSRGYRVAVRYRLVNPDLARVSVGFTCANPHEGRRQGFAYVKHYVVVRRAGGWSASVEGFEITGGSSGLPNLSMQPTAFGRG